MKTKALLLAAFCVTPEIVYAQAPAPRVGSDVPPFARSIALEMVELISSGDSPARARFVERNFSAAGITSNGREAQRILNRLQEQSGGVRLASMERAGRNTFVTVHAPKRQRLALVNMAWDRTDSTKLRLVEVLKAWNPQVDSIPWPDERLPESALKATIEANVSRLAAAGGFSGTALVARRDRIIFARGYGLANRDDSISNAVSTRYATASMGKMFTAVAIAQLIEGEGFDWTTRLRRFFPTTRTGNAPAPSPSAICSVTPRAWATSGAILHSFAGRRTRVIASSRGSLQIRRCSSRRARGGRTATRGTSCSVR